MLSVCQIQINVSARGLKISQNPNTQLSTRCHLLTANGLNESFIETDKTEFNDDCINPDWDKKFLIAFKFAEIQNLRFDIYQSLTKVGQTSITLAELVTSRDGFTMKAIKSLEEKTQIGKLLIYYRELETTKEVISMHFSGKALDKKDIFGLSDPYLVISNIDRNGNMSQVYRSEVIKQTLSPVWQPIKIRTKTLCQSDRQMKLQFDCFDWDSDIKGVLDKNEKVDFIGSFTTTFGQLLIGPSNETTFDLINPNKLALNLNSYTNSGQICLDKISMVLEDSFVDYLRSGTQFHMKFAIDFTSVLKFKDFINQNGSNSYNVGKENIYSLFLTNFSQIINQYNRQNIWTFSGFNAIFEDKESNDYFELTPNQFYENVETIIKDFELILENAKPVAKRNQRNGNKCINIETTIDKSIEWIDKITKTDANCNSRYFILLLLTSELNKETFKNIDSIIGKTNSKPISIIIIDININENNKEIPEITQLMNEKTKLNQRINIEIVSVQILQQSNDWQILVNKTVRDVINRIPDQCLKYLLTPSKQQV